MTNGYIPVMDALKAYLQKPGNSQAALAAKLGLSQPAVAKWFKRGQVPPGRVLKIEAATGGDVTRHELRPDLYPPTDVA